MHGRLIEFALAYYREPLRYPRLADVHHPLPAGFAAMIPPFGAALAPRHLSTTAAALHASPEEVLAAGRFLIRQVLLAPGATPWRMLGFEAEAPGAQIRRHYQLLIRLFHPDRRSNLSELDTEYASRLNSAYHALRGEAPGAEDKEGEDDDTQPAPDIGAELIRYFQPQPLIAHREALLHRPVRWKRLTRRILLAAALLLILGVVGFILFSLLRPTTMHLQMATDRQAPPSPLERQPSYLQGTASSLPPPVSLKTPPPAIPAAQPATAGVEPPPPTRTLAATGLGAKDQPPPPPTTPPTSDEADRLIVLEQRQGEIAAELSRIEAERLALVAEAQEQARHREEEAKRIEAQRLASQAEAERHQRQVAEAEARLQAERQALERQKAEQAKRQAEQARLHAEEHQAAMAETRRKQEEAALAAAKLKAERQALERLKAEQAQREQAEAKRREAELRAAHAEVERKQQEIAASQARLKSEFEALKQQQAKQQKPVASAPPPARAQAPTQDSAPAQAPAIKEQPTLDLVARPAPKDADRLLSRFTQAYAAGDLEAYVSLFTPDARFSEGVGQGQLRSTYRQFFARTPYRQSVITGFRWKETADGRLTGKGNIQVKIRREETQPWDTFNGTIELELTALNGQWKIMRMEHQVK